MSTRIKGYKGSIKVSAAVMGNAKSWSLNITQETEDVTTLGSNGFKESLGLLKTWSGSIVAIFDSDGSAEGILQLNLLGDDALVDLEMQTGNVATEIDEKYDTYTGTANITSQDITNDVNGIVEVTFNFEGSGTLVVA